MFCRPETVEGIDTEVRVLGLPKAPVIHSDPKQLRSTHTGTCYLLAVMRAAK